MQIITPIIILLLVLMSCKKEEPVTEGGSAAKPIGAAGADVQDVEGNVYRTVVIGLQTWMADNLKTSHYANGDTILSGRNIGDITGVSNPQYFFYPGNDSLTNLNTYGRLYTYYVVEDARNVCPTGWRIPTKSDWDTLVQNVGGDVTGGGKLKSTSLWNAPNTGADNLSSFNALPAGFREANNEYQHLNRFGGWWTSTADTANRVWTYYLKHNYSYVFEEPSEKKEAYSIRCIK